MSTPNGTSPYKNAPDSPSRQLLWELSQMAISSQQGFYAHLDRENEQRATEHRHALATAAEKHEHVLQSVELERKRLDAQIQAERERREAEARKEIERQRREKAEREIEEKKREIESAKAVEAENKRLAELERAREETSQVTRKREEQQRAEAAKREQERRDVEQKRQEESQRPPPAPTVTQPSAAATTSPAKSAPEPPVQPAPIVQNRAPAASSTHPEWEAEHNRYLEIHQQLKQLRKFMNDEAKKKKELKTAMGDMRREMRKCVGQLTEGKGANKQTLQQILTLLRKSLTFPSQPHIPISPFLATPPQNILPSESTGPGLLIYLLNIFSKQVIGQYIAEASVSTKSADPVGIIASHIFAHTDFKWHNHTLISILLAKFHIVCPILFGITGSESTPAGRTRLGWWREVSRTEGDFISQHKHYERMTGLGAGFASLSLRNYEKSRQQNPYPDSKYWEVLARIANTPSQELTQTHFVVLKAMIQGNEERFVRFFGKAAVAALRLVLVELPRRAPSSIQGGSAVRGCEGLVEVMKREKKLVL